MVLHRNRVDGVAADIRLLGHRELDRKFRRIKAGENVVIETGGGTDEVMVTKLAAVGALGVHLGDGNADRLNFTKSRALGAILIGGDGTGDELLLSGNKWRSNVVDITDFELEH